MHLQILKLCLTHSQTQTDRAAAENRASSPSNVDHSFRPCVTNTTVPSFFWAVTHFRPGTIEVTFQRLKELAWGQGRAAASKAGAGSGKLWEESDSMFQGRDRVSITVIAPDALCMTTFHMVFSFFCYLFTLAMPRGLKDLSSQTRDWTHGPCNESMES